MKKKRIILALAFLVVFLTGITGGRVYQHLKTGYHHKVLKTESFPFPNGELTLSYTAESIGMPFLDPETSVLTITTKCGLPITVYKAQRIFQESYPHVRDVFTEANRIEWTDGISTYQLTVEPIEQLREKAAQPAAQLPSDGEPPDSV